MGVAIVLRYQGVIVPVRVASGSMAEQLLGPHRLVTCAECGFAFRCGIDADSPLQMATCPNCGFERNDLSSLMLRDGDRVVIDRWAYFRHLPQRGDVVAFVDPTNQAQLAVKRVMGLPGEVVAIRRGELFVDGQLHRKSLEETKKLATLVYDDAFRLGDASRLPPRWQGEDAATDWRPTNEGYRCTPAISATTTSDWLMYRHWRCYTSPNSRTEESPITDNYAYNQGLSRELHEVTDLLLSCELTVAEDGEAAFLIHDGWASFMMLLSAKTRSVALSRGEDLLDRVVIPNYIDLQRVTIELGAIDDQILVAVSGETLIRHEYLPLAVPLQPTSRPLGIAARRGDCSVSNVRVYRDIHHLNPIRGDWAWTGRTRLGVEEFLVLGDNSPLSNDSRHWPEPELHRELVIGKVLMPRR